MRLTLEKVVVSVTICSILLCAIAIAADSVVPEEATADYRTLLHKSQARRMGHVGARKTWLNLNRYYPGHRIPYQLLAEYVSECGHCQKYRLGLTDSIQPVHRSLQVDTRRQRIGMDALKITAAEIRTFTLLWLLQPS
mmetsp:Transcript_28733/g.48207  ORF Transcript_28733/g.48207 Transcript_28733/m.48207 type:complete len:138 (+) Transcript_28733:884-1297(+)